MATGGEFLTQNDPTDHALAAIASILDHSNERPDSKNQDMKTHESRSDDSTSDDSEAEQVEAQQEATPEPQPQPVVETVAVAEPIDIDHYSKLGPGPLDAIRFRWTARRDDVGRYFVDETIGPNSRPLVLGPMPRHEVVEFIDERERDARRRFDALKREMTIGNHATHDDSDH